MDRFFAKIIKTDTCWVWVGCLTKGYGKFKVAGKMKMAHRVSYELHSGEIPKGMLVCHTCDNPGCVNPTHLFLGTHQTNNSDKAAKNRTSRQYGTLNPMNKLTENEVRQIIKMEGTQRAIAEQFGVSAALVNRIKKQNLWTHLT